MGVFERYHAGNETNDNSRINTSLLLNTVTTLRTTVINHIGHSWRPGCRGLYIHEQHAFIHVVSECIVRQLFKTNLHI